jgi:hypothetical protein
MAAAAVRTPEQNWGRHISSGSLTFIKATKLAIGKIISIISCARQT